MIYDMAAYTPRLASLESMAVPLVLALCLAGGCGAAATTGGATAGAAMGAWPPHPRLRLGEAGVQRIKAATVADPTARALLLNISAHVDELLAEPLPSGGMNGSHGATGLLCDTIRDHLYSYGLLFRLSTNATKRAHLAARAAKEMVAVAQLTNWNPKRFLTVAETMHSLAIGYDWFYESLTPAQRTTIEDGIFQNGVAVGMGCYADNCTW